MRPQDRLPRKHTTLRLEPELHRRLKIIMALEGKSIQFLFTGYVERYTEQKKKEWEAKGVTVSWDGVENPEIVVEP